MDSRRGISIQWRLFFPALIAFWTIIVSMAWWQIYRVRQIKKEMVFDQLELVADRVSDTYGRGDMSTTDSFLKFIGEFYNKSEHYDSPIVIVRDSLGNIVFNIGDVVASGLDKTPMPADAKGMMQVNDSEKGKEMWYMYFSSDAETDGDNADGKVYVFLPYTMEVANSLSASTTRFWFIFFAIGIFTTIFVYISSSFFTRNIKVLRNFATKAAQNKVLIEVNEDTLPHDELGETTREIISLYNQLISEMDKREHEHKVALSAIEDKNRVKRELTSNISHELKTPVGVIQGYIDTLVDNPDMDIETRDRFLYKAQAGVHRLTKLIADITAITRLEHGGKMVNLTEINLHDLVFSLTNELEEGKVMGKMTLINRLPLKCYVHGNDSLLQSVVTNLVKNAVAYSGGTECCIETTGEDDKFYYFRFYDNGVGVPPECLPFMFERFYRINSGRSRETGGTGLGLAIVHITIESLGGSIDVDNHYPSGLEYRFSLPKYKGPHRDFKPQAADN